MTKDNGGPAFPSPTGNPIQDGQLTLRDWFAGMALQGILAGTPYNDFNFASEEIAHDVYYSFADAMLKVRGE